MPSWPHFEAARCFGVAPCWRWNRFIAGALLLASCSPLDVRTVGRRLTVADCPAGTNVLLGTTGADVLTGTSDADCIVALEGDDLLMGGDGNDFLIAGPGNDMLQGGGDSDVLYGEGGEDLLSGGSGADDLFGGDGSDVLIGDAGTDSGAGEADNDAIAPTVEEQDGGSGTDTCSGTSCEVGPYAGCSGDDQCSSASRCSSATACVSCAADDSPACTGALAVGVDVDEICGPGFIAGAQGTCVDIDECQDNQADCDALADCRNLDGGYACVCPDTHAGTGEGPSGCMVRAVGLSAGRAHTCALLADGRVKCWGDGTFGQLGLGNTASRGALPNQMGDGLPAVPLGAETAKAVLSGSDFNCVLLASGKVACFGHNSSGQLGIGSTENIGDEPAELGAELLLVDLGGRAALELSLGDAHACAALADGQLVCWGDGTSGELGLGQPASIGDGPGEMGSALAAADLGPGASWARPRAGLASTVVLRADGTLRSFGHASALLGNALVQGASTPALGDEPGEMGATLLPLDLGTSAAVEDYYTWDYACVLFAAGDLRCFGENAFGQLGKGDTAPRGDEPGEMGSAVGSVDVGGSVRTLFGTQGGPCVELTTGAIECWGENTHGGLGLGDTNHRGDDPAELGSALPATPLGLGLRVLRIVGGPSHRCALFEQGEVKCWGAGGSGRLGLGSVEDVGDEPGEMGDSLPTVDLGH